MENASHALMIAGSILIAIMIITVGIYVYNTYIQIPQEQQANKEVEQIIQYNQQYESYNRKNLYGSEIISLANKIISNNRKYDELGEDTYHMSMEVKCLKSATGNFSGTMSAERIEEKANINGKQVDSKLKNDVTEFKRRVFKCTGVEYNTVKGQKNAGNIIQKMKFEEVKVGS